LGDYGFDDNAMNKMKSLKQRGRGVEGIVRGTRWLRECITALGIVLLHPEP
jgi:hypothetical protein